MENLQFKVADFKMDFNTFLGRPTLSMFMMIPHYAYLVLKILGLRGVISIRGDVKRAYDWDRDSCETADRLTASARLQDMKQAFAEYTPWTRSCPRHLQDVYLAGGLAQQNSPGVHEGALQGCSHRQ
jgi:hypothetical protein